MEYQINTNHPEDAEDLFLIAKDRLLDVNEWNSMLKAKSFKISLTDTKGQKAHRNARMHDLIKISENRTDEKWVQIAQIQYDNFPDINSESISLLLQLADKTEKDSFETILIKREKNSVTVHCNVGNELPELEDETPNDHINNSKEQHPVLNIPKPELQQLLQSMIAY